MSRIVSVWLRAWPIARLLLGVQAERAPAAACPPLDRRRPLVLVAPGKGGMRITALNRAAQRAGLASGDLLSNARSKVLDLQVCDADPAGDAVALRRLALWCMRYTPVVAPWDEPSGADGLFLDITGCAHLFGGEEGLLADLDCRLRAFGLAPRLAVADTAGTAWGVAHHGGKDAVIVAPGDEEQALRSLPLAALRLDAEANLLMRRLGLRRIGEVMHQPRAPFAARFPAQLLRRLDQALGRVPEPLVPVIEPPVYRAHAAFAEPILSQEHVLEAATRLLEDIVGRMERDAVGARLLRLMLFKVASASLQHDAGVISLDLGLATPSRDARHIAQLIGLRLHRLASELETDFGFEAAAIHVLVAEPLSERQNHLAIASAGQSHSINTSPEELAHLIDRLQHRLGRGAVRQLVPRQSHIPERAMRARPAAVSPSSRPRAKGRRKEPAPEPADGLVKRNADSPPIANDGNRVGSSLTLDPTYACTMSQPSSSSSNSLEEGRSERRQTSTPVGWVKQGADPTSAAPGDEDRVGSSPTLDPTYACSLRLRGEGLSPAKAEGRRSPSPRTSPTYPLASARREEPSSSLIPDRSEERLQTPVVLSTAHARLEVEAGSNSLRLLESAWGEGVAAFRPLLLLEHPETAEVLAVVPDGPPRHFRWRGVLHQVAEAQGPERIAPEWWRRTTDRTRDYFMVEDAQGRRFWLYRAGLYGESDATPQWFVHGVFA